MSKTTAVGIYKKVADQARAAASEACLSLHEFTNQAIAYSIANMVLPVEDKTITSLEIDKEIAVQAKEKAAKAHLSLLKWTNRAMAFFLTNVTLHVEMKRNSDGSNSNLPVDPVPPPDADGGRMH